VNVVNLGILCSKGCKLTPKTISYLKKTVHGIDTVICETGERENYSESEIQFKTNHRKLRQYLLKHDTKYMFSQFIDKLKRNIRFNKHNTKELCKREEVSYFKVQRHSSEKTLRLILDLNIEYLLLLSSNWLIKDVLLDSTHFKIINFHNALLPKHRGLDSLMWSIVSKDPIGLTAHIVDNGIDTGPIINFYEIEPKRKENILELRSRLKRKKPKIIKLVLDTIKESSLATRKQKFREGTLHDPMDFEQLIYANNMYNELPQYNP